MIAAVIVPEDEGVAVDIIVSDGTKREKSTQRFGSVDEAEAYLSQYGYVPAVDDKTGLHSTWVPNPYMQSFEATHVTDPVAEQMLVLHFGIPALVLFGVCVPGGYGFRFGVIHGPQQGIVMPTVINGAKTDPVLRFVTSGLFHVSAIGTWPTVDGAVKAGKDFFDQFVELIGGTELLYALLGLEEEQGNDRGAEAGSKA